jgi:hypothetical protein
MKNLIVKVKGSLVTDFLVYLEDEMIKENNPYSSVEIEEVKDYGSGKKGGGMEIIALTLGSIGVDLLKTLIIDYLKDKLFKKKVHAATYKIKNDEGEELIIQLNELSLAEIEDIIKQFRGKIMEVEITSEAATSPV